MFELELAQSRVYSSLSAEAEIAALKTKAKSKLRGNQNKHTHKKSGTKKWSNKGAKEMN